MRHKKGFNHLSRTSSHRKAMLANMASSLIMHKRINTTIAKAKALKKYVEPLITKSKEDTTHSRRVVFSYLQDKYAVTELFREVSPKIADRPGGYTRILKTGSRLGDNADMCIIELVDYNENLLEAKEQKKKTTRRRRGGSAKPKTEETVVIETTTEDTVEDVKAEVKKEEQPKAEAKEEKAEVKKEVKEKKEEPKKAEVKKEEVKEEPKAEEKTEAKKEEKKDDTDSKAEAK